MSRIKRKWILFVCVVVVISSALSYLVLKKDIDTDSPPKKKELSRLYATPEATSIKWGAGYHGILAGEKLNFDFISAASRSDQLDLNRFRGKKVLVHVLPSVSESCYCLHRIQFLSKVKQQFPELEILIVPRKEPLPAMQERIAAMELTLVVSSPFLSQFRNIASKICLVDETGTVSYTFYPFDEDFRNNLAAIKSFMLNEPYPDDVRRTDYIRPGGPAGEIFLHDSEDTRISALSLVRDKPVVFWVHWLNCPSCEVAVPVMQNLYRDFGEIADFYFVDQGTNAAVVEQERQYYAFIEMPPDDNMRNSWVPDNHSTNMQKRREKLEQYGMPIEILLDYDREMFYLWGINSPGIIIVSPDKTVDLMLAFSKSTYVSLEFISDDEVDPELRIAAVLKQYR